MTSAADIWEKVKSLMMEGGMPAVAVETWFGDVEAVALEDTRLILCVPTDFKRNIIRTKFLPTMESVLKELFFFDVEARAYQSPAQMPLAPDDKDYLHQY